ncbi:MAG: hypothetical protein ACRD8W_20735 [Nitrososphaeraceae archaeon]
MNRDNEPNAGWKRQDEWYLNRHDNVHTPDIQVLTEDNYEDEVKELREYLCALCKGRLDYLKNMDMSYCEACVSYYDTKIQDVPIKDLSESKVRVSAELEHYHTYEEDDIWLPFVEGINPGADSEQDIPGNIEVVSDDGHRKHIRVKGLPTEALSAMRELDGRE